MSNLDPSVLCLLRNTSSLTIEAIPTVVQLFLPFDGHGDDGDCFDVDLTFFQR